MEDKVRTVAADGSSVVTCREIANVKAKSINETIKTVRDPGCGPPENVTGSVPKAQLTASGGSVICAGKLSNVTIDGDINLSVFVGTSQEDGGTTGMKEGTKDKTLGVSKHPLVRMMINHKVELIECLMPEESYILQHAHSKSVISDIQYLNMKGLRERQETVISLMDHVICGGPETCAVFLKILKDPDVLSNIPRLRQITETMEQSINRSTE